MASNKHEANLTPERKCLDALPSRHLLHERLRVLNEDVNARDAQTRKGAQQGVELATAQLTLITALEHCLEVRRKFSR